MREILFRGKRVDNGEWVEGGFFHSSYLGKSFISVGTIEDNGLAEIIEINPESVGQFTGILDKNSNKIFEGDILCLGFESRKPFAVFWNNDLFMWSIPDYDYVNDMPPLNFLNCYNKSIEVVGNIHDNPELIK